MTDDSQIFGLVQEILDTNRSPEEVCANHPELLGEVRRRLNRVRHVGSQLDAIFPTSDSGSSSVANENRRLFLNGELPQIPGYEVESILGRGGMGVVYKARQLKLNRSVALKMLIYGAAATPQELARFQREAEAVAALRHPQIVQVYDVGEINARPYYTMEFVEGGRLAQKLAGAPQPARQAAELVKTLAEAIQAAHDEGIVHRDLKPANILLTANGTPKIADFGLARHFDSGPELTLSGARLGTPSYMAPEQVSGDSRKVGPAADIYALGAILYEMLTGRPPFRAETTVDTERQITGSDPVPPTRLNPKVPRDLETICLKCLHKAPERRYPSAAALADDLRRFELGEPIVARPTGIVERAVKWVRRHPTWSTLLAATMLLTVTLVGGSTWLAVQQAHLRGAIAVDLNAMRAHQEAARWADARTALERAEALLGGGGPDDLRARLAQARRELDFVIQLNEIRMKRATRGELAIYRSLANRSYADAFRNAGRGTFEDRPEAVAKAIQASAINDALMDAVYDWAVCADNKSQRDWLLRVARQSKPHIDDWREKVLTPDAWEDLDRLSALVRTAPIESEPVSLLLAVGERLWMLGGDPGFFVRTVQSEHPADFWPNLILGDTLLHGSPGEAAGYYRAALAARPTAAVGYCGVGDSLRLLDYPGAAIQYYEKALKTDPTFARTHNDLGLALQAQGRLAEAIVHHENAVQLDPDYAWPHFDLGNILRVRGHLPEAYQQYQEVLRLDPKNREVQEPLRNLLVLEGRGKEALALWKKTIDSDPSGYANWSGYAELCLFLGQEDDYHQACTELIKHFGDNGDPMLAEQIGRACLLVPATDKLEQATSLVGRAFASKGSMPAWFHPYFDFAQALSEYRHHRFEQSIELLQGDASTVMASAPQLVLAMAQYGNGQKEQARKTLDAAVLQFDWSMAQADSRDVWICHILRREAEALIVPNLSSFLDGSYQPTDIADRLALVGICQAEERNYAAAQFFADAFASDPELIKGLISSCRSRAASSESNQRVAELAIVCRYPAARSAALACCGLGKDATAISAEERSRWRKQAREWLQDDLAMWSDALNSGSPTMQAIVRKLLSRWQVEPDLAGVRELSAIRELPSDEQPEWLAFWKNVADMLNRVKPAG
jgi:eukaryotic-like serine/threonine-protein kinase